MFVESVTVSLPRWQRRERSGAFEALLSFLIRTTGALFLTMREHIPGARYACLPRVGHLANLEAPQEFDRAILGFLREALPRTTAQPSHA